MATFLHVNNRTRRRIHLDMSRIDIDMSGNQLAIVSIPGDRLSGIGSPVVGADGEAGEKPPREETNDRKR